MKKSGIVKYLYISAGLGCVVLGMIGIIIPGMPTTIFLILASGCFAKSSPCLHAWLLHHPWFGPVLMNWQESKSIPKKAKRWALTMMVFAGAYSLAVIDTLWLKGVVITVLIFPAIFVFRLPLSENAEKQ